MGGGLGRSFCVALPFILTAVSLVTLLIVGLAGVTGSNLSLFEIAPKDLSISLEKLKDLKLDTSDLGVDTQKLKDLDIDVDNIDIQQLKDLGINPDDVDALIAKIGAVNMTAETLGLADKYNFYLFTFTESRGDNTTKAKPRFDYAADFQNITTLAPTVEGAGVDIDVPQAVQDGLKAFATCVKWAQIVFIIAVLLHAATILVGIGACFSRIGSCVTWIVSTIALVAIAAFATLTTLIASIVVGALSVAKPFGLKSSINTAWLAIIWIGVAAGIASGLFWLFTICCCKGRMSEGRKSKNRDSDTEKLMGSSGRGYQPLHDPHAPNQASMYNQQQFAIPMGNVKTSKAQAYEPYSHHAT